MEDLLNQSITLTTYTSGGIYNEITITDTNTIDCRIVDAVKFIPSRDGLGESISITKTLWTLVALKPNDIVKYDNQYYQVQFVEEWRDGDGDLFGAKQLLSNYVNS